MNKCSLSRHATIRADQRGLTRSDIDMALLLGTEVEGGYFVREKDCDAVIHDLKRLICRITRLRGKRVVVAGSNVVTTYHAKPKKARHLLQRAEQRNFQLSP